MSHKVVWLHQYILGGASKQRVAYDQINICQFVQGFVKGVLDEKDASCKEKMLTYLCELMEDANDFFGPVPRRPMQFYSVRWRGVPWTGLTQIVSTVYVVRMPKGTQVTTGKLGLRTVIHVIPGSVRRTRVAPVARQKIVRFKVGYIGIFVPIA